MSTIKDRFVNGRVLGMQSIAVIGPFDFNDSAPEAVAEETIKKGDKDLVLDLRKTSYITSPGIACIIKILKKVQTAGGTLYVHGATQDMIGLLRLTRLAAYIHFV